MMREMCLTLWAVHRQHRRFRANVLVMLELALMIINLIAFLVPNIYLMACPCCVNVNSAIAWSAFVRWTCWNTVCIKTSYSIPEHVLC